MIRLFAFQAAAVDRMAGAIEDWRATRLRTGRVLRDNGAAIPFVGSFEAIMGSGKTPLLASSLARLGPALVVWTTKSSAVAAQTYDNLTGSGKYADLLPAGTVVRRGIPSRAEWRDMLDATAGLTIWVMTTAAWNSAEAERDRLHLRRVQRDWAGDVPPWEQLGPSFHARPLWVVYDESHNQTDAQLDQLVDIEPYGILTGTGTTRNAPRLAHLEEILAADSDFALAHAAAQVRIATGEVVAEGLLKSEVRIGDAAADQGAILDGMISAFRVLTSLAATVSRPFAPRALYVVEESNAPDNREPRPVTLWRALVARGIAPEAIAVFTNTRGELPVGLEKVTDIAQLRHRHRHIIFNKALAEGWDDPENYFLYFDGVTRSETRINQVIGRVLRQPGAARFEAAALNAAYVLLACPTALFEGLVTRVADDLRGVYGTDSRGNAAVAVLRLDTATTIDPVAGAAGLRLPNLDLVRPAFDDVLATIRSSGGKPFDAADLEAAGVQNWRTIDLTSEDLRIMAREATRLARNTSASVREHFIARLRAYNRFAANLVPPVAAGPLSGLRYSQVACHGSPAAVWADQAAAYVAARYTERAAYAQTVNPARAWWAPSGYLANGPFAYFDHAAHSAYPAVRPWLAGSEMELALALDAAGEQWSRNPNFGEGGYSIPLATPVEGSQRFFPDFAWWAAGRSFVIGLDAAELMASAASARLCAIEEPRVVLVAPGRFDAAWTSAEPTGLTALVREGSDIRRLEVADYGELLARLQSLA